MRLRHRAFATAFALLLATSACGSDSDTAGPNTPAIDISKLDTGNYPTTPADIEQTRNYEAAVLREAIRIGNAMPLVMDVDNRFIFEPHQYFNRWFSSKFSPSFSGSGVNGEDFNSVAPGLVVGWYTYGQRREEFDIGRSVAIYTLRFSNADQAAAAARTLADRSVGEALQIPGYPAARTTYRAKTELGTPAMYTWLTKGDLVLHVRIDDPISTPFDPVPLADITRRAFDKQIEMLKNYAPTPADQIAALPLDVDGLLSRTLPLEKDNMPVDGSNPSAVYPKQAALHPENYPNLAKAAFDDAGVDYVAVGGAHIYRTRDAAGATRLLAAIETQVAAKYDKIDSPPNLPTAHCFDTKAGTASWSYPPMCLVPIDRYVAQIHGSNVQDMYQRAAAQYKLLSSAR